MDGRVCQHKYFFFPAKPSKKVKIKMFHPSLSTLPV